MHDYTGRPEDDEYAAKRKVLMRGTSLRAKNMNFLLYSLPQGQIKRKISEVTLVAVCSGKP